MIHPNELPNPFRETVFTDPWQPALADVLDIHKRAFDRCRAELDYVRTQGRSASVLIYGEPGSGKTHLLARVREYLASLSPLPGSSAPPGGVFVAVQLQTSPQMIWRYLRRRLVDDLLRPNAGSSQFERLMLHRLAECVATADARLLLGELRQGARHHNQRCRELETLFDHAERQAAEQQAQVTFDINFRTVVGHLLLERHTHEARAWLRGDELPDAALARLEAGQSDLEDVGQEDQARETVLALSRLIGPRVPLVFCFDQVEALQINPRDDVGLFAFGQVVTTLHDQTNNVLLISCIQSSFADLLKQSVSGAARDRLNSRGEDVALTLLTPPEARLLLEARLKTCLGDYPELARANRDGTFWPLQEEDLTAALGPVGRTTPRKLLAFFAARFEVDRPKPRPTDAEFLGEEWQRRLEKLRDENAPGQTDEIVRDGLPRLLDLKQPEWRLVPNHQLRDVELLFEGPAGRVGVSLCNHQSHSAKKGLPSKLERLRKLPPGALTKLVLLRDERLELGAQAHKTREHRAALQAQGARWHTPSREAMAALAALRALLAEAQSGELANGGETVGPQTVREWLLNNLPPALDEVLDEVLLKTADDPLLNLREDLLSLLQRRHVVRLAEAAVELRQPEATLEECVQRHFDQFGLLGGPPAVLFELTNEVSLTGEN
jgi:hypothetical protein